MEIKIRKVIIKICVNNIHPFLFPKRPSIGIENLSTKGAKRNFKEYVSETHAKKPTVPISTFINASHVARVEKINM